MLSFHAPDVSDLPWNLVPKYQIWWASRQSLGESGFEKHVFSMAVAHNAGGKVEDGVGLFHSSFKTLD